MEKKYTALRIIGSIYKVLGGLAGVITILAALAICVTSAFGGAALDRLSRDFGGRGGFLGTASGFVGGLLAGIAIILYGGGLSLTLFAMGEGIFLLLALEENTRATARLLQSQTPR